MGPHCERTQDGVQTDCLFYPNRTYESRFGLPACEISIQSGRKFTHNERTQTFGVYTLVERIQKLKPDEAYWGKGATDKQNGLKLVYKNEFYMWGKVARNLSTTQRYDANNGNAVNLNGYTAYLIYDVDKKQVFHAHIRRNTLAFANTEHLRYKNKLNWRVKPAPYLRDDKYLGVMPSQFLSGSPTLQFP